MHNLLVLLEQNIETIPASTLKQFIVIAEQTPFVADDEWGAFLIGRLKQHTDLSQSGPLIDFLQVGETLMESASESSSPMDDVIMVSDSPLSSKEEVEMTDGEEKDVEDCEQLLNLVLSQHRVIESSPSGRRSPIPLEQLRDHSTTPAIPTSEGKIGIYT